MIRLEDEQLAAAFDALDSGVVVLDGEQRVVCWNDWFASASGLSSERGCGKTLPSCFPDVLWSSDDIGLGGLDLGLVALSDLFAEPRTCCRFEPGPVCRWSTTFRCVRSGQRPYSHCLLQIVRRHRLPPIANGCCAIVRTPATTPWSRVPRTSS